MRKISVYEFQKQLNNFSKNANIHQEATKVLDNTNKIQSMLSSTKIPEIIDTGSNFVFMVKDYFKGYYISIPTGTIVAIIFALIYLLNPLDIVPDIIPLFGLTDDVLAIRFVYELAKTDVEKYKLWKSRSRSKSRSKR